MNITQELESILSTAHVESVMEGVTFWRNVHNGFAVADLSYWADPAKRGPEWIIQSQAGVPKAEWNREYGSTWTVYEGKSVYQDYDDDGHVLVGDIVAPRRTRLISGWDGGPNDVNLAWVLGIVIPGEVAVIWIDEYQIDDGDIYDFVQVVGSKLNLEWAKLGGFSLHVADQSVFTASNVVKGGKAMADIMRQHGMAPIPGEISFAKRRAGVERLLKETFKFSNGKMIPKWRVHERCSFLREAMRGGYAYPKIAGGVGGEYKPTPLKNKFYHICNAMEYAASRLQMTHMEIPYEGKTLPRVSVV